MKIIRSNQIDKIFTKTLRNSKIIIHAHGVFDLLHIGHIRYLKEAKKNGDILIVTITSDKYVNKGQGRPFFNQNIRSEALAALSCVDYVLINNDYNAVEIIKHIKAKYYIKGADYKSKKITEDKNLFIEKKAISSVGGKMIFSKEKIFSSSMILNRNSNLFNKNQKKFINVIKKNHKLNDLIKILNELKSKKILVIGETILDEYVFCKAIGKSGKEPILVNQYLKSNMYAGGVLSVANNISDFCKSINLVSFLGEDSNKYDKFFKDNLNKNIKLDFIKKKNSPTIVKSRFIDSYNKNKFAAIYKINSKQLDSSEEIRILNKIKKKIDKVDYVIIVDYGHGLLTDKITKFIKKKAKNLSVNCQCNAFNVSQYNLLNYNNLNYLCLQEGEIRTYFKDNNLPLKYLIKKLSKDNKINNITITKGSQGVISYDGKKFYDCPAFANSIKDRIGAGDTLFALTSLMNNLKVDRNFSLFCGSLAASQTVATIGTGNVYSKNNLIKSIEYSLK